MADRRQTKAKRSVNRLKVKTRDEQQDVEEEEEPR